MKLSIRNPIYNQFPPFFINVDLWHSLLGTSIMSLLVLSQLEEASYWRVAVWMVEIAVFSTHCM